MTSTQTIIVKAITDWLLQHEEITGFNLDVCAEYVWITMSIDSGFASTRLFYSTWNQLDSVTMPDAVVIVMGTLLRKIGKSE